MLAGETSRREMNPKRLTTWLRRELGLELQAMAPVGGGCIHRAWCLKLQGGRRLFAKSNRAELLPVLEAEAEGLRALAAVAEAATTEPAKPALTAPPLTVPPPLQLTELDGEVLLLLPWLELSSRPQAADATWRQLGGQLAQLHRRSLEGHDGRFGWHRDNWIGSAPQRNGWDDDWGHFFAQWRLAPQLRWAVAAGQRLEGSDALLELVPHWLRGHGAEPCLVHGDLWSGNAGLLAGGGGAVFDPAVYRGDREVDLAMARMFGGFPEPFFAGYQAGWPLAAGHGRRQEVYNLYHLLNHANLFGGGYWRQVERGIQNLLRSIDP